MSDEPFQPRILLFQALQPFRLIDAQAAVLFPPLIVGLFRDSQLATRVDHAEPFTYPRFRWSATAR